MTPIFSHPAHIGPIKCVAAGGRFLVSGGSDEEIRIFNIAKRVEVGFFPAATFSRFRVERA